MLASLIFKHKKSGGNYEKSTSNNRSNFSGRNDIGNVSWRLISIDLESELMEIEIAAPEMIEETITDAGGKKSLVYRLATDEEKQVLLASAQHKIEGSTADELYASTGARRLLKHPNFITKYDDFKKTKAGGGNNGK